MEYHDDIFLLLWHLPPLQIQTTLSSSLRRRAGSSLKVILNSSTKTLSGQTVFSFANQRLLEKYAVLASLPGYRLQMLVETGLVAFSNACFEFADEDPGEVQHGSLANVRKIFARHPYGFWKVAVRGAPRSRLLASSFCCHAAFISSSTPGPAHQPCAQCRHSEGGASSAALGSMVFCRFAAKHSQQLICSQGATHSLLWPK